MFSDSSSSTRTTKIIGAVLAATALVAVGVVMLGDSGQTIVVDRAQAIVKAQLENANVPLANLPDESQVRVPQGWKVESDEPMGIEEVEENPEQFEQESLAEDDEIDSPLDVQEDENGEKYVAETDEDVIVTPTEEEEEGKPIVAADRPGRKCFKNLKKCGYRKRCKRVCNKKCAPYTKRVCKAKKFCKCYCKFHGNIPKARKCVVYKKTLCKKVIRYRCRRRCKKYCKRVPWCYCCSRQHVRRSCRKLCKKIAFKTKCGNCRCYRLKCYKWCKFVCRKFNRYNFE